MTYRQLSFRILFFLTGFVCFLQQAPAQNIDKAAQKLEKYRSDNWPPLRSYTKISLGYALQQKFKMHAQFCGFDIKGDNRDYVPNDIHRFLGGRTLRTKVETADIRGGGLMFYIFHDSDLRQPFDVMQYSPSKILTFNRLKDQYALHPDDNFDTFILTKTCGGYLKAALDAGIEPPYAAFKAALETDSRRESSVLALSGSFVSPLKLALDANNDLTAEALLKLWKFYQENPTYVDKAYYLREFEGVLIRHITSAEENRKIATEGGVDLNGLLPVRLKTSFAANAASAGTFAGTDWETIIYADFEEKGTAREKLFSKLPTPAQIRRYFEGFHPVFQKSRDFPVMTEGADYKHFLIVEGIPDNMTANFWEIEGVKSGVYEGMPSLQADYFRDEKAGTSGCRFTVTGKPLRKNFEGTEAQRPGRLGLSYAIRSRVPVGGEYIRFYVNEEVQTSAHPVATVGGGEFDLTKKEDRKFAFQWKFEVDMEDQYNPVNFAETPYIGDLTVRRSDKPLNVKLSKIETDAPRKKFILTLETLDTYPLEKIDDVNMQPYNLSLNIHLKNKISNNTSVRPLKSILYFPSLKPDAPKPETAAPGNAGQNNNAAEGIKNEE
jgi:hypothetical protein